jgi:hypothetical protein
MVDELVPWRRLRPAALGVLAVALALTLGSCGDDAGPELFAMVFPGAPLEVRERVPLPFCGEEDVRLSGEGVDAEARTCFVDAWQAGEQAEFVSTYYTVEGDPITQVFRVVSEGRIQLFVDNTRARFGGRRGWLVRICREYTSDPPTGARCEHPPTPL